MVLRETNNTGLSAERFTTELCKTINHDRVQSCTQRQHRVDYREPVYHGVVSKWSALSMSVGYGKNRYYIVKAMR